MPSPAVPIADPAAQAASAAPVPQASLGNQPAPGLQGPKGLGPRTSYSRVNTGTPPVSGEPAATQKGMRFDTMKVSSATATSFEDLMTENVTQRMSIQEMVKAAGQGVAAHAAILRESSRQLGSVKQASVPASKPAGYSAEYVEKLAQAVEYLTELDKEATAGEGPGALPVSESKGGTNAVQPGSTGEATPAHQSPMTPAMGKDSTKSHDPGNAMETTENKPNLPNYPVKLSSEVPLDLIRKMAGKFPAMEAIRKSPGTHVGAAVAGLVGGTHLGAHAQKKHDEKSKEASIEGTDTRLVDFVLEQKKLAGEGIGKQAEDAINPAKISAGPAVEPDTSSSGESGGAPAGGQPEGPRSLISSNEAAMNFTKGEAKAPVKADMKPLVIEPALSSAHDSVLQKALDHTGQAGVKISSGEATKTAAARALLEKLAAEADDKAKKEKKSTMGPGTYQAPAVGGAAAGGM